MSFDQSISKSYRNSDMRVKRHSDIDYRNNDGMEDAERTPFGLRLYQSRLDAELSQEEARLAVGMKAQSTLSEAEISGKRSGFTPQLAHLYGVSSTWLATGKGAKHQSIGINSRMAHLNKLLLENPEVSDYVIDKAIKDVDSAVELLKKAKGNGTQ